MADTVPWMLLHMHIIKHGRRKIDGFYKVYYLIFILFTFVYGWGTLNAGTAARHRDNLVGIFIMCTLMLEESKNDRRAVQKPSG